jgi:hypothetical protein
VPRWIRFRSPGVKPGQKVGPLGPFRGRLGVQWVVAPLILALVLAVAGWAYLRGAGPGEPWLRVGTLETMAPGTARHVGEGVMVGRLEDGELVAVAGSPHCPLYVEGAAYRDCVDQSYRLDGTPAGEGPPLDLVPVRVDRGAVYVDPTTRIPR